MKINNQIYFLKMYYKSGPETDKLHLQINSIEMCYRPDLSRLQKVNRTPLAQASNLILSNKSWIVN